MGCSAFSGAVKVLALRMNVHAQHAPCQVDLGL